MYYICCTPEDLNIGSETTTEFPSEESEDSEEEEENKYPLFPKSCGQDSQINIYGGEKTKIDEFPWTVLIRDTSKSEYRFFE